MGGTRELDEDCPPGSVLNAGGEPATLLPAWWAARPFRAGQLRNDTFRVVGHLRSSPKQNGSELRASDAVLGVHLEMHG
jgi:hypothetical protein